MPSALVDQPTTRGAYRATLVEYCRHCYCPMTSHGPTVTHTAEVYVAPVRKATAYDTPVQKGIGQSWGWRCKLCPESAPESGYMPGGAYRSDAQKAAKAHREARHS